VDRSKQDFEQIFDAQQILDTQDKRDEFAAKFMYCQGLFEFLWPDTALRPVEDDYKYLAKVYASIAPNNAADLLLWYRLGAKTSAIVHEHLKGVTIDADQLETVAMDAEAVKALQKLKLFDDPPEPGKPAPTALEVLERLEERIRRRMEGDDPHRVWKTLAERLELLRLSRVATAAESVEFLKALLELARKLLEAEDADDDDRLDEVKVVDPRKGALTQIFDEYKPDDCPVVIETVIDQVDALVQPVRGTGWQTSHPGDRRVRRELRQTLKKCGLPIKGPLYDNAYAYIRENY
jgi:type I restriction enzyme R subunit